MDTLCLPEDYSRTYESYRLLTFKDRWPEAAPACPFEFARAGLYYIGKDDVVRCAFCGLYMYEWQSGDNPVDEHKKFCTNCCFVKGQPCGNVSMKEEFWTLANRGDLGSMTVSGPSIQL